MMKTKLITNDPERGPNGEYYLCPTELKDGSLYMLAFTKHEVRRAFARRKRVLGTIFAGC